MNVKRNALAPALSPLGLGEGDGKRFECLIPTQNRSPNFQIAPKWNGGSSQPEIKCLGERGCMSASKRIIIAEDDEDDRFVVQWAFGRAGLKNLIVFARDGRETVDVLQMKMAGEVKMDARLLLLDIRMPKLDGFGVLKWLQDNRVFRPAQVVVFSSSYDPKDIERAMALGADDYKIKPIELSGYMELVREFEMRAF
jgi:CheY-like chemotaxis protein